MTQDLPPPRPGQPRAVLIGAGITSALAGCLLAADGFQVVVVEAREKGAGSSSRSAAAIRQQFGTPGTVRGMIHSVRFYERFRDHMRCAPGSPAVLVQNGYLFLYDRPDLHADPGAHATRWDRARERVQMQRDSGLADVGALTPAEVGARFPWIDASRLAGATWCPTDGFLRPDLVYGEGFRRLEDLGGRIVQWAPVTGAVHRGGRLAAVETARGTIEGDLFVNATNAWAPRVSRLLGGAELPVSPVKRYLYFLQRAGSLTGERLASFPMTITARGAYCRPENADQLMAGWAHPAAPEPGFRHEDQDEVEAEYSHRTGLENHAVRTWMELAESMPPLGEFAGVTATAAGYYADTPDHNPLLGYDPGLPNLIHACGFSGHGAMQGPFTAEVVRQLAAAGPDLPAVRLGPEGDVAVDLAPFRLDRSFGAPEEMVI